MNRINNIIKNQRYLKYIEKINFYEKNRVFCRHDVTHFLDVCRLAEIEWLGQQLSPSEKKEVKNANPMKFSKISRELIYAAGLLHDIGRWQEYENEISHEIASANLAPAILEESGFVKEEIEMIVEVIKNHRNPLMEEEAGLSGILYRADKKSRPCFLCLAEKECNWSKSKKNLEIR